MLKNDFYSKAIKELTSCGKFKISLGLERVLKLLNIFDNPQKKLKIIHVAGTNGKGSTCAMLAKILECGGYKTGLYTSPHLIEYTERLKINDIEISKKDFGDLTLKVIETASNNNIDPTEFEILTVMAFLYFYEKNVDIAIIETGLGGRLDATNVVINPLISIITSIDLDHTDRLGETIEQIASEKAGIIKDFCPLVTLKNNKGLDVIKQICREKSASIHLSDYSDYTLSGKLVRTPVGDFNLSLKGLWQLKNLSLVLEAVNLLKKQKFNITSKSLSDGLNKVKWNARFQYIKEQNIIIDGAHNPSAAKQLRESLDLYFPEEKRIWVYSSLSNKNYSEVLSLLIKESDIVICTKVSSSINSADPQELKTTVLNLLSDKIVAKCNTTIHSAIIEAKEIRKNNELIIVAGSLYSAGEALFYIKQ